jgi:hypothetical protein
MSAGFDVAGEIAASLGDRNGAWRFIRRFAESWLTPLADADGCREADLRAAEERLKVGLPTALSEAYALLGRREDLTSVQDRLLGPDELKVDQIGQVLVFRVENQHVASWGVPLAGYEQPDPPVVLRSGASQAQRDAGWEPYMERFSLACVEMVLSESLFTGAVELGDNRPLDAAAAALLEQRFARLAIPDYPLWAEPDGLVRWFGGPGVILRDDGGTWLWVRARTVAALEVVRATLPGEWLMVPD